MCGFVAYEQSTIYEQPQWYDELDASTELTQLLVDWPEFSAYPAFGSDIRKRIPLLIQEDDDYKQVNAVWWFDAFDTDGITKLGNRTSFNARNLSSPFWKHALNTKRGVILASELGESKLVGKTKHQYLMQSNQAFLLGALYKRLKNGDYCCAIITRDAHPKMAPYHDKAFPLFLPLDIKFTHLWLGHEAAEHPQIQSLLEQPKLFPSLHVQRVKTYKDKQPIGNIQANLTSDLP